MKQLLITAFAALAATASMTATENIMSTVTADGRTVTVTALTDNIIRISNTAPGETIAQSPIVNAPAVTFSGSITKTAAGQVMAAANGLTATLSNNNGAITVSGGGGRTIEDNSVRYLNDGRLEIEIATTGVCSFYGTGERSNAFNLAGDTLVMYNRANYGYGRGDSRNSQMNINMPLVISSKGYALLFDDFAAAELILSNPIRYITESNSPVSYYFINGAGTLSEVTSRLTELTGRQDMPPFWSLGYITSRYGYKTESETRLTVDTLKRHGYPLDGLVLDLYWYGKEEDMGRLDWEPLQWGDHRKMLADLKKQGVNVVAISQPFVLENGMGTDNFNALKDKNIFVKDSLGNTHDVTIWVGHGGMFDVSSPDARRWLTDRYRTLTDEGITGWWGDLGEPEVHPATAVHANGLTARQYHNLYGNDWASIIYDLFEKEYPDTRLFTLMRAGTTGLQRYSVFPWSSDVARTWGGLQAQIPVMLNSGLSGLGYMSHDVGGFAVDENLVSDPEMYVRWLQLGVFSPILRTHAQKMAEPYKYPEVEPILLDLVKQRYSWLPYIYTLAWENASQGLPLVRPLNFYSGSSLHDDIEDQYLWGRDIMVAPVIDPGVTSRKVVIPEGQWLDFHNPGKVYTEGDTIDYAAPLDVIPLMVRAGAFIPSADYKMGNTDDYNPAVYTVTYFPVNGVESSYTLFEDDRQSPSSLRDKAFCLINFNGKDNSDKLSIGINFEGTYPGMPAKRHIDMNVKCLSDKPKAVTVNGKNVKIVYDPSTGTLTVPVNIKDNTATSVEIVK